MNSRIGLVGCGRWGRNILRDLCALDCSVIVADPSADAREAALRMGAVRAVESSDEINDSQCDGYVVASPIMTLAQESEVMLRRGKPVFCEKPVFQSDADKEKLLAAGAGGLLFAMYKFCYHPGIEALREIAASGELGEMESIGLQRLGWDDDFQGCDCLWLVAVHQLSIAWRILGFIPEPESVCLSRHDGVITAGSICLGKCTPVMINVSSRHLSRSLSAVLYCSRGVALLPDAYAKEITIKREGQAAEQRFVGADMPLLLELAEFVGYLRGGPRPRCGFDMAAQVSAVIQKVAQR